MMAIKSSTIRYRFIACTGLIAFALCTSITSAKPTQEDVFKSISSNVDSSVDGGKVLAVLAAGVGLAIVLTLFSRREKREAIPRPLNNQSKLLRELTKTAGLKPNEIRQLKAMAEQKAAAGDPLDSALTLLLCPSVLKKIQSTET